MSISEPNRMPTDFDEWLTEEFSQSGIFTCFAILVEITETKVTPLCSTYFNIIGDDADWNEMTILFAGAGVSWDGAAFFPELSEHGGTLDNPAARLKLRELEERLDNDRLVLNEGHFFDKWGRRLKIEEIGLH